MTNHDRVEEIRQRLWYHSEKCDLDWPRKSDKGCPCCAIRDLLRAYDAMKEQRDKTVSTVIEEHSSICWKPLHGDPPPLYDGACAICQEELK